MMAPCWCFGGKHQLGSGLEAFLLHRTQSPKSGLTEGRWSGIRRTREVLQVKHHRVVLSLSDFKEAVCVFPSRTQTSQDAAVFSLHGRAGQKPNGEDKGITFSVFFILWRWVRRFSRQHFLVPYDCTKSYRLQRVVDEMDQGRGKREGCFSYLLTRTKPRCAFWSDSLTIHFSCPLAGVT